MNLKIWFQTNFRMLLLIMNNNDNNTEITVGGSIDRSTDCDEIDLNNYNARDFSVGIYIQIFT